MAVALILPTKAHAVPFDSYKITEGDTFWYIGQRHGISVQTLLDLNPTADPLNLQEGQTILLKSKADQIIEYGKTYMGTPYVFGGKTPAGFDCSGFTRYVFAHFGINLPAGSYNQTNYGQLVAKSDLQPGDLIFTDTNRDGKVNHVSIYIGNDQLLHTYKTGVGVTITKFSGSIYDRTFVNARRVL
jgi:cell wall-associated NlpC family hydrolase